MRAAFRAGRFFGLLLAASTALAGCAHSYEVENRDTPVHVWLSAPDLGDAGGSLSARVEVGGQVLLDGPVTFRPGVPTVELPIARVRTGSVPVAVTLDGGRVSARQSVGIPNEAWIRVVVRGGAVSISSFRDQPPAVVR